MPSQLKILSIDAATECGWAHTCGQSGTWYLKPRSDESSGMRLLRFRGKLEEIRKSVGVDLVVYEKAIQYAKSRSGAEVGAELQGVLKLWCEENKIQYKGFAPSEIKAFACGKKTGKITKERMVDAAEKKWKRTFEDSDNNEVDALWLIDYAKSILQL